MYELVFKASAPDYDAAWDQTSDFLQTAITELISERPEHEWHIDPIRTDDGQPSEFRKLVEAESGPLKRVLTVQPPYQEWFVEAEPDQNPVASAHLNQLDELRRHDQLTSRSAASPSTRV